MKKLTVIGHFQKDYNNYIIEDDMKSFLGGVYLHGDVETFFKYDCVSLVVNESDEFKISKKGWYDIPDGIYECKVIGYDKPCTAFIWKRFENDFAGLIVDNEDDWFYNDAKTKYENKSTMI